MNREHIETLRHFVYKATKWNDAAGEYANDIGVDDALDALEARAEAGVIRTLYEFRVIDARGNVRDEVGAFETPDDAAARCDAGWPHQGPHRAVQVALVEPTLTGGASA